ncbi:hypothetical protein FOA43_000628 [Brettanomyces nanus]|uniref:Uncharacterized protein n=1 Tax=Eeniella nana TaxID=13502 RepID=A0A875RXG1_EENNA|nr:uncharacterized protein FOA43_000628 [Brettanomyces nanus]QPG73318.1 hypothetical protein FOA43_000628 [Brettanomyces nanus]
MQIFMVHPNLEVSDCDSAPSAATINDKKQTYLHNLRRFRKLIHRLSHDDSVKTIPDWCLTRDTENNVTEIIRRNSGESTFDTQQHAFTDPESDSSDGIDNHGKSPSMCSAKKLESINTVEDLPIETVQITDEDQLPFKEAKGDRYPDGSRVYYLLDRMNLPKVTTMTPDFKNFLALKYFQLTTDLSLVEFKYIEIYSKINKIIKEYFSKPELTPEIEDEGFSKVNVQMDLFRKLENVLVRLRRLRLEFEDRFGELFQNHDATTSISSHNDATIHALVNRKATATPTATRDSF